MERILVPDPAYELWVLIHQVDRAIYKARDVEIRSLGISPLQSGILFLLKFADRPVPLNEIATWLVREPHTISELITRMEKQGLVKRVKQRGNNQTLGATLTSKGKEIYLAQVERRNVIESILSILSSEEVECLKTCLHKLRERALDQMVTRSDLPFP
ncbi:MAG: MarR family transcriptional regulator [Dehalococcoidia bacterium]